MGRRPRREKSFAMIRRRWVVERTFARFMKRRRLVRDQEQIARVAEAIVNVASTAILVGRSERPSQTTSWAVGTDLLECHGGYREREANRPDPFDKNAIRREYDVVYFEFSEFLTLDCACRDSG